MGAFIKLKGFQNMFELDNISIIFIKYIKELLLS